MHALSAELRGDTLYRNDARADASIAYLECEIVLDRKP